jgi:hypothetical protein
MPEQNIGEGAPTPETQVADNEAVEAGPTEESSFEHIPNMWEAAMAGWAKSIEIAMRGFGLVMDSNRAYLGEMQKTGELVSSATGALMEASRKKLEKGEIPEFDPAIIPMMAKCFEGVAAANAEALESATSLMKEWSGKVQEAVASGDPDKIIEVQKEAQNIFSIMLEENPALLREVADDVGFHVEDQEAYQLFLETPRAKVYQVFPNKEGIAVNNDLEPVLIETPPMLGSIAGALNPKEGYSYAHMYANQGIPTYVVLYDNVNENDETRDMGLAEWRDDIVVSANALRERHGRPVTLAAICQGALLSFQALSSSETQEQLNGSIGHFIQEVPPNDQTVDPLLQASLEEIPESMRELPELAPFPMSLPTIRMRAQGLHPLKNMVSAFKKAERKGPMSKFEASQQYWLGGWGESMPLELVRSGAKGLNAPISNEGALPVELDSEQLNMMNMFASNEDFEWDIFTGDRDTVVHPDSALAPLSKECLTSVKERVFGHRNPKGNHVTAIYDGTTPEGQLKNPDNSSTAYWRHHERILAKLQAEAENVEESLPLAA